MSRKKALRTDNQQERLIKIGWITGFVDGEGCFSLSVIKQSTRKEKNRIRQGYRFGYQIFHEFAVTQGEKSLASLKQLHNYFRVGQLHKNKRYDNHKETLYRYVVRKRDDLLNVIIPFFQKYQLRTSKQKDFGKFVRGLLLIKKGKHLTKNGIIKIIELISMMNQKKSHQNLIRILRDHTPPSS